MDGQNWRRLKQIASGKLEKGRPDFCQVYPILYESVIYGARKSSPVVIWPWFCQQKTIVLPINFEV